MFLGKRATLQHLNRAGVTSSDRRDLLWFGLRTVPPLGAAVLIAGALVGCAQSPVQTSSRSYQTAPGHHAWLPAEKRHRRMFATTESVPQATTIIEKTQPASAVTPGSLPHSASTPIIEKTQHATRSLPHSASVGVASFYTEGTRTANGERLNPNALTAAHPSLPFGTRLRITSVASGRSVVVRVNDRGPFIKGRVVDVSYSAAKELGMTERGVAKVRMEVVEGQ